MGTALRGMALRPSIYQFKIPTQGGVFKLVEIQGLKPWASALPARRSNQLSYIPLIVICMINRQNYSRKFVRGVPLIADTMYTMTAKKISRSNINVLLAAAIVVAIIGYFFYWYQTSYLNSDKVFWGTISNNLKTSGVTRTNTQNLQNSPQIAKVTQVTQMQYAPELIAKITVASEGENNQKLVQEAIGTTTADFLRYTTLNISGQNTNKAALGKWGKSDAKEQAKPQILADALIGSVLFFGNLSSNQRGEIIGQLKSTNSFQKIELINKSNTDSRKVYTYNIEIALQPYSEVYKKYLEMIGQKEIAAQIGQQQAGATYKAVLKINAVSRQPISITTPGSEQPELYSDFGRFRPLDVPSASTTISELQAQLRQ